MKEGRFLIGEDITSQAESSVIWEVRGAGEGEKGKGFNVRNELV